MLTFLILSYFTLIPVESEKLLRVSRLMKSQNEYVPMEELSITHHDDDDDDPTPEEDMTTVGIRDYINDDLDDDPLRNRSKLRKYGYSDDNYVNLAYRPTKKMISINSSRNFLIATKLLLQSEVPYSEEPWPTITLSTFDVIVPMFPTWPSKITPPTWRSHFPPIKPSPSRDEHKRNASRDGTNFTTERASKFDVGILDRFIYPEEYVVTTPPADEEFDDTSIPTFLSRSTITMAYSRPTLTWFNPPKPKNKLRVGVVVKFTNSTRKALPSRTKSKARRRFSVLSGKTAIKHPPRPVARARERKWLCYTCGLNLTAVPDDRCHKVFSSPDGRYRGMMIYYQTDCLNGQLKAQSSFHKHGCFWRYLDVGGLYEERGCRDVPPKRGTSFASKKFQNLETLLKWKKNGCVNSPYAVLMPFSRAVQLFARYHVCVCHGKFCNASSDVTPKPFVTLVSLLWHFVVTRETGALLRVSASV